jgi:stalled ribosome alternative rescue factor ArfA
MILCLEGEIVWSNLDHYKNNINDNSLGSLIISNLFS